MTLQETQSAKEKVLKFVRDANPSTMELKFGCRVLSKKSRNKKESQVTWIGEWSVMLGKQERNFPSIATRYEILGSDMGLENLLIALEKNIDVSGMHPESQGMAEHDRKMEIWQDIADRYDLSENLHNQDPNFYIKLLPLLSNE